MTEDSRVMAGPAPSLRPTLLVNLGIGVKAEVIAICEELQERSHAKYLRDAHAAKLESMGRNAQRRIRSRAAELLEADRLQRRQVDAESTE